MKAYKFRGHAARRRREALGLTAREVAEAVGISEGAVCAFERTSREPSGSTYIALCRALDVDEDALRTPVETPAGVS